MARACSQDLRDRVDAGTSARARPNGSGLGSQPRSYGFAGRVRVRLLSASKVSHGARSSIRTGTICWARSRQSPM